MTTTFRISSLNQSDKKAVQQSLVESYIQYEHAFSDRTVWLEYLDNISTSLDNPGLTEVLVAKRGNTILGSLQLFDSSEKAYGRPDLAIEAPIVRLLGVHPSARGEGVAQSLIKESIRYASAKGAESVYLHSGDLMAQAIRIYEWLGFKRDQSKEFYNRDVLVKCYRYDIEEGTNDTVIARTKDYLDSTPPASISGII